MNGKNHAIAGAGAGIAMAITFAKAGSVEGVVLSIPAALAGAKLPDADHPNTKQGKIFSAVRVIAPIVAVAVALAYLYLVVYHNIAFNAWIIAIPIMVAWMLRDGTWFWGHRHGTHTLIFPLMFLVLYICLRVEYQTVSETILSLDAGYLSHLVADTFTARGCPLLYPFVKKEISLTKVKSKEENKCRAIAIVISLFTIVLSIVL